MIRMPEIRTHAKRGARLRESRESRKGPRVAMEPWRATTTIAEDAAPPEYVEVLLPSIGLAP